MEVREKKDGLSKFSYFVVLAAIAMSLSSCFEQKKALSPSNDYEDCNPGWDIHIFSIPWNYERYLRGEPLVYPNRPVWEVISF